MRGLYSVTALLSTLLASLTVFAQGQSGDIKTIRLLCRTGANVNYAKSDVLVAFRVVEIDSDGSALIDWKLLKRFRTPQLATKY